MKQNKKAQNTARIVEFLTEYIYQRFKFLNKLIILFDYSLCDFTNETKPV